MFWIVFALFLCVAILILAKPFYGLHETDQTQQIALLKQELAQTDLALAAKTLPKDEAIAKQHDIARRLQAIEMQSGAHGQLNKADRSVFLSLSLFIILTSSGLYAFLGSPELAGTRAKPAPIVDLATPLNADRLTNTDDPLQQLTTHLRDNPEDTNGWRTLGWASFQARRYEQARMAYEKAVALDPNDSETFSALGEALVLLAQGQVTAEAQRAFRKAIEIAPMEPRSSFYMGLSLRQNGDLQGALDAWTSLLQTGPANAPWRPSLYQQANDLATEMGVQLPAELSRAGSAKSQSPRPGPSEDDIRAVQNMSPEARASMIKGMVASLEQKLVDNPNDLAGWEQLIRSRIVLKEPKKAITALLAAQTAYADNPAALAKLSALANDNGLVVE